MNYECLLLLQVIITLVAVVEVIFNIKYYVAEGSQNCGPPFKMVVCDMGLNCRIF